MTTTTTHQRKAPQTEPLLRVIVTIAVAAIGLVVDEIAEELGDVVLPRLARHLARRAELPLGRRRGAVGHQQAHNLLVALARRCAAPVHVSPRKPTVDGWGGAGWVGTVVEGGVAVGVLRVDRVLANGRAGKQFLELSFFIYFYSYLAVFHCGQQRRTSGFLYNIVG
jgi:hypothetical protein